MNKKLGKCNPSECNGYRIERIRIKSKNKYGEISVIEKDGSIILKPEKNYEKEGIEDARLSEHNGTYYITYIAFNKKNGPRIALASTKDFKKIKRHGIIGPEIKVKDAISLIKPNSYYKKFWSKLDRNSYLPDKDAGLEWVPSMKKWALWHRIEPAIQIAYATRIEDFKKENFWKKQIKNLDKNTILKPGPKWTTEKIGLGGLPINIEDKRICHVHGVQKKRIGKTTKYFYRGTIMEINKKTNFTISIIKKPILTPSKKDTLIETHGKDKIIKYINFPTIIKEDPKNLNALLSISGLGDKRIGEKKHNKKKIFKELDNPKNSVKNWYY
jgi:predicted GH43/DUF377 family glycosyl hydrolase